MNPEERMFRREKDTEQKKGANPEIEPQIPGLENDENLIPNPPERHLGEIENFVHKNNFEADFGGAKDQLISVLEIVKGDEEAVELIHQTLDSIFRYIETIYIMETKMKILGFRLEGEDYKERISRYDSNRKKAHDALISNLIATTRHLNKNYRGQMPTTGIYNGKEEDLIGQSRHRIGDWAIELEHEILLGRNK